MRKITRSDEGVRTSDAERVGIVGGTDSLGLGLAKRLAAAGLDAVIGSREASRAREAASAVIRVVQDGGRVEGRTNAEAAAAASVVFIAVPFGSHAATLKELSAALSPGAVVVDTTVPLATAVGGRPLACGRARLRNRPARSCVTRSPWCRACTP